MLDVSSIICSLKTNPVRLLRIVEGAIFTSSFPGQKRLLYLVTSSCSVSDFYFNLCELGVVSVFGACTFRLSEFQWNDLIPVNIFLARSRELGSVRPQWLDIATSEGVF